MLYTLCLNDLSSVDRGDPDRCEFRGLLPAVGCIDFGEYRSCSTLVGENHRTPNRRSARLRGERGQMQRAGEGADRATTVDREEFLQRRLGPLR